VLVLVKRNANMAAFQLAAVQAFNTALPGGWQVKSIWHVLTPHPTTLASDVRVKGALAAEAKACLQQYLSTFPVGPAGAVPPLVITTYYTVNVVGTALMSTV
jgi:hypothetical protein